MALDELKLDACRQTKAEPLASPAQGDEIVLQFFRPDAAVDVAIDRRGERRPQCSTTVNAAPATRFRPDTSPIFRPKTASVLTFQPWSREIGLSKKSNPFRRMPWPIGRPSRRPIRRRSSEIALAKSIQTNSPLRLVISAGGGPDSSVKLFGRPSSPWSVCAMYRSAGRSTRSDLPLRIACKRTAARTCTDSIPRGSAIDATLLGDRALAGTIDDAALVFVVDDAAPELSVKIADENRQFSGVLHLDAEISDTSLIETYHIRCKPESEFGSLACYFSTPRQEPVQWKLATVEDDDATRIVSQAVNSFSSGLASRAIAGRGRR